jgi:propionyl-CoA carboxylase alpha chain
VLGGLPTGWRNVPSQPERKAYAGPAGDIEVTYRFTRAGPRADSHPDVRHIRTTPGRRTSSHHDHEVTLEIAGVRRVFSVRLIGTDSPGVPGGPDVLGGRDVFVDSALGAVALRALPRFADPEDLVPPGSLLAPMPGTVVRILAERGATVTAGEPLVVLEAMKMEHRVAATTSGVVTELNVTAGQQVDSGTTLAVIVPPP